MGLIGKLFGSDKVVTAVSKGIDEAFFTEEEKAKHFQSMLKAYEPFKLTQRSLVYIVGVPYVSVWVMCAVIYALSLMYEPCLGPCRAVQFITIAQELADWNNRTLGTPFALIMGLYFGGGMLEGALRARKD